jgi:5'-methylthioadenosine phosphorylase
MAYPVSPRLRIHLAQAAEAEGISFAREGTYVCIEGPQFSTLAESMTYKNLGYSVIGMTNMPEAKLAREAELPYALIGMVTDYDCWREGEAGVDTAEILALLKANAAVARRLVGDLARSLPKGRPPSPIDTNLDHALITAPEARDPAMLARLDAICRRVLAR